MQYHAIPSNTMQYHACLITGDGAYHCPVGSIRPFLTPFPSSSTSPFEGRGSQLTGSRPAFQKFNWASSIVRLALIVQYIGTFQNKIRTSNKIWTNRPSLYFILAVSIVEEQLNCDLIFVYFNLRWFCLFKAGGVYLLQFSAQGSSGRVPSNFRFLCGRGNWIVCWSSGGRTVSRVSRVKKRGAKITEYWYS